MGAVSFMAECGSCGHKFAVAKAGERKAAAVPFAYASPYLVDGSRYFLTTYDCPYCGSTTVAQVDDGASLKEVSYLSDVLAKAMGIKSKKRKKELSEHYKTRSDALAARREALAKELDGKDAVADGKVIKIKVKKL